MFDFFGTFLDGPLAGSTFGGVLNDGSGGDSVGPFLALGGMAFVLAIVLSIIIAPFVAWPSLIASDLNEGRGIWGAIILIAIQFIFIILRIRSNVRHWKRSFLSDLLLNMLFLFLAARWAPMRQRITENSWGQCSPICFPTYSASSSSSGRCP